MNLPIIILKYFIVAIMLIYMATLLFAKKHSNADFEIVKQATIEKIDLQEMQQAENRLIKRFYGLNSIDYNDIILYYPLTNMGANEVLLVKLNDESQSKDVVKAIEERLAAQKKSFDGYGVEQTELLNNGIISVQGNYILFVVNQNAAEAEQAFKNSL